MRSVRTFEAHRDLVKDVQNIWDANNVTISRYDYDPNDATGYAADNLGRRAGLQYSGLAFGAGKSWAFEHDACNELASATSRAAPPAAIRPGPSSTGTRPTARSRLRRSSMTRWFIRRLGRCRTGAAAGTRR